MVDYVIDFTDPANGSFVIKPFTTNGPASPRAAVPLDTRAVTADTSIVLLGRGMEAYGERIQESIVHMLEHFAFDTAPVFPIQGQIWFKNTAPQGLFVYDGATWQSIVVGSFPLTGNLDMGGFRIENLGDPNSADDAVNLGFADTRYVNVTGDTMTGLLTMSGVGITLTGGSAQIILPNDPTAANHAVRRNYIDNLTLNSLADVTIAAPTNGQTLIFNSGSGQWENQTAPTVSTLDDLTDVTITGPIAGEILSFDGFQWVNSSVGADRYVTSGSLVDNELTLNFSTAVPSPSITVAGLFAMDGHSHISAVVTHDVYYPDINSDLDFFSPTETIPGSTLDQSYLRRRLIGTPDGGATGTPYPNDQYPAGVDLQQVVRLLDQALYIQASPNKRDVFQSDGVTTLVSLDVEYTVGVNKLFVFNNGVKQYASQRFAASVELDTPPVNEGSDTGLTDGVYSFDITVNGTIFTGGSAPSVIVAEDRTITAVTSGLHGTWTISGNFANELGPGTYFKVTGNGDATADKVYTVRTAVDTGPDTVITVENSYDDTCPGCPNTPDGIGIPAGATGAGTLRKPYYYQQLLEDLDASFVANGIPAAIRFHESAFNIFSDVVGSGSTVFVDSSGSLWTSLTSPPSFLYRASRVGIDRADNTTAPDEFDVLGDYSAAFTTGVRFVVFGSAGNDEEYVTVANAVFAAGVTTIFVTNGSISVNEASGFGTGTIYFARDFAYEEVGAFGDTADQINFLVAPTAGDIIEVMATPELLAI